MQYPVAPSPREHSFPSGLTIRFAPASEIFASDKEQDYVLFTNLGANQFRTPIAASAPLASGKIIQNPGMAFLVSRRGETVTSYAPCCWNTLSRSTASRKKVLYNVCEDCRTLLGPAPLPARQGGRFTSRSGPSLEIFCSQWASAFYPVLESILIARDLQTELETAKDALSAYQEKIDEWEKLRRREQAAQAKARRDRAAVEKFLLQAQDEKIIDGVTWKRLHELNQEL